MREYKASTKRGQELILMGEKMLLEFIVQLV